MGRRRHQKPRATKKSSLLSASLCPGSRETMTNESQAMVKKVGLISLGGVILLAFSKMIFP